MKTTKNYNLNKVEDDDFIDIVEDFNENTEIIDDVLGKKIDVEEGKTLSDNNFTNELKEKLEQASENKHSHTNKSVLDKITQALINAWNSAVEHINDTVKHITAEERNLWNTVKNKADSGHTHDERYYTESEIDSKVSTLNTVINGKADSNHIHNYVNTYGYRLPQTGRTQNLGGLYTYATSLATQTDAPTTYTAMVGFGNGTGGSAEISVAWADSGGGMWYRALRDVADDWYAWTRLLDSNNYKTYCTPANIGAATSSHTHNYAGSSSAGGAATSADKLNTNAGNSARPVYFSNGKPVALSGSVGNASTPVYLNNGELKACDTLKNSGKQAFFVAASDAAEDEKAMADYVCDGARDEDEISRAISNLDNCGNGGCVKLSSGHFNIEERIELYPTITLQGTGRGTALIIRATETIFELEKNNCIKDLRIVRNVDCYETSEYLIINAQEDGNIIENVYFSHIDSAQGIFTEGSYNLGNLIYSGSGYRGELGEEGFIVRNCCFNGNNMGAGEHGEYFPKSICIESDYAKFYNNFLTASETVYLSGNFCYISVGAYKGDCDDGEVDINVVGDNNFVYALDGSVAVINSGQYNKIYQ